MHKYIYRKGFTLTEVLVALGLIGVIMSISIPTYITSTSNKTYVAALKRGYLALRSATDQLMTDNGGTAQGLYPPIIESKKTLAKYCSKLSCLKQCLDHGTNPECWAFPSYSLDGATLWEQIPHMEVGSYRTAILTNGMNIAIRHQHDICLWPYVFIDGENVGCAIIALDVNGFSKPNRVGRDIFMFYLHRNGLTPAGVAITPDESDLNVSCNPSVVSGSSGNGCAGKVLAENRMTY